MIDESLHYSAIIYRPIYITHPNNSLNSVFMMKLSVRFFLLALTFFAGELKDQVNSETVCVETKDVSIFRMK